MLLAIIRESTKLGSRTWKLRRERFARKGGKEREGQNIEADSTKMRQEIRGRRLTGI